MPRSGPQRGRQPAGGVVVGPALAVHHLQGIDLRQNMSQAGRRGSFARPLLPADQGLGCLPVAHGVLGRADDTQLTRIACGAHQDPDHRGGRFSANARGPSLASSVAKTSREMRASLR